MKNKTKFLSFLFSLFIVLPLFSLVAETEPHPSAPSDSAYKPWYTGPLFAPNAANIQPGHVLIQPYLFIIDTYGRYNSSWGYSSTPTELTIEPTLLIQTGITNWLDITFNFSAYSNHQEGKSANHIGDTSIVLGFQIAKEKKNSFQPYIRFTVEESFPTGKYNHLDPKKNGIDSTSSGSYETFISLQFMKNVFWFYNHPMNLRLGLSYSFPQSVTVKNFNSYGGGYGTSGKVQPGNVFSGTFGHQISLNQRWVFAYDVVYSQGTKVTFSGTPGKLPDGTVASNTSGSSTQLSLAPALEYNFSDNIGIIGGVWFSVLGRNATDFFGGVISVYAAF